MDANDTAGGEDSTAGRVLLGALMVLVDLAAVVGNLLVIAVIARTPQLRNLTHGFVLNLCVLDLLCAFVVMPVSILSALTVDWRLGEAYCRANGFLNAFFAFSSILTLSLISVERYYSIASPMDHAANMTPTKGVLLVAYVWVQSALLSLPPLFGLNRYAYNRHRGHCTFVWEHTATHIAYVALIGVVCFLVPAAILVVTYCNVFRVARQAAKQITPSYTFGTYGATAPRGAACSPDGGKTAVSRQVSDSSVSNGSSAGPREPLAGPGAAPGGYQRSAVNSTAKTTKKKTAPTKSLLSISSSDLKAAKTILIIVSTFLLMWTPYFGLHLYGVLAGSHSDRTAVWERLTTWVAYLSSAVNPLLYGALNRQIRQETAALFRRAWERLRCDRRAGAGSGAGREADSEAGGAEDFFQFLERTSAFTKSTSVTSGLNSRADNGREDTVRIPGQIPEISEGDPTQ